MLGSHFYLYRFQDTTCRIIWNSLGIWLGCIFVNLTMQDQQDKKSSGLLGSLKKLKSLAFQPKTIKYTAVSAVSVVITQGLLFLFYGVLRKWSATTSNIMATAIAAVPSYYLNRAWAWGKTGKSHFMKEVVPFWALAFLGLALSVIAVGYAHHLAVAMNLSHMGDVVFVNLASLAAFGILWVGKFFIFNRVLFVQP